ncbi:Protein of unknown function DUF58 [Pedococcus cremeus]|uniref:DUF58 domain-containing protein n=1 Tax=Pedococcus cremeus TaxID=587636 RepID=A0A1H9XTB0_9MICO|nr:DUF58 domain-containing protein [Pedococcus cremeus]SES49408.1 Protein of unknown function DUF58 [Pedococcus cremeus]
MDHPADHAPPLTAEGVLRRLEWRVVRRLDGRLQGDYRTLFRGEGVDFHDLREYEPGDDLRHVDWNVTARMDTPYVRQYTEDREATAWLLLDRSASMAFGPVDRQKDRVLVELALTLAQVLVRGGNRVGAVLFDNAVERVVPPGQGRRQVLRVAHHLLQPPRSPTGATDLAVLFRAACGVARRRSLVVVLSDFVSVPGWGPSLGLLARRHDVVAVQVLDPRESRLPSVGMVYVEDAETGEQIFVDTDDPGFQRRLREAARQRQEELAAQVRSAGTELHTVSTDQDLVRALARISELRRRIRR